MARPLTLPAETVREIRRTVDQRKTIPSDRALAARFGVSVGLVRKIGRRELYRTITD